DLSDGLSSDLHTLCEASSVGAEIEAARLPTEQAIATALGGGEDYELLFTVPPRAARGIARLAARSRPPLTLIGRTLPRSRGLTVIDLDGTRLRLRRTGYEHFRKPTREVIVRARST